MFNRLEDELDARKHSLGLSLADLLILPDALRQLMIWMMRQKRVSFAEIAEFMENDEAVAKDLLDEAYRMGYVRVIEMSDSTLYCVRMAPKRVRGQLLNIWDALDTKVKSDKGQQ